MSFEKRASKLKPEQLVQGWPQDYLEDWKHPDPAREAQRQEARRRAMPLMLSWMAGLEHECPGIMVHGRLGFGKTDLLLAQALVAARAGFLCRFATAEDLANMRDSAGWDPLKLDRELMAPEVLVIDDAGTKDYSGNARAFMLNLVRQRKAQLLWTAWTSNLALGTDEGKLVFAKSLDARILSTYGGYKFNANDWVADGKPPETLRKKS